MFHLSAKSRSVLLQAKMEKFRKYLKFLVNCYYQRNNEYGQHVDTYPEYEVSWFLYNRVT